jgi:hypothetical protein
VNALTPDQIIQEAEKVASLIATARRLMAENKSVDLFNLEHKISVLCKKAEIIDLGKTDDIRDILISIVKDLNRLDDETTSLYKKSGGSFLEDNTKRAIDAYGLDDKES